MQDKSKDRQNYIHPIHGVWPIIGFIGVITSKYYFSIIPSGLLICPSRTFFGIRCPGCGSGTAVIALSELRVWDSIVANPLFVIGGFALSLWGAIVAIGYFIGKPLPRWDVSKKRKAILRYGIIIAFIANWIYEAFFGIY